MTRLRSVIVLAGFAATASAHKPSASPAGATITIRVDPPGATIKVGLVLDQWGTW